MIAWTSVGGPGAVHGEVTQNMQEVPEREIGVPERVPMRQQALCKPRALAIAYPGKSDSRPDRKSATRELSPWTLVKPMTSSRPPSFSGTRLVATTFSAGPTT